MPPQRSCFKRSSQSSHKKFYLFSHFTLDFSIQSADRSHKRSNYVHFYSKIQIIPPVFSLTMRPSVRVSFCRASAGIRTSLAFTPSETSS